MGLKMVAPAIMEFGAPEQKAFYLPRILVNILLHGINGELEVMGVAYKGAMPAFKQLSDAELAAVSSYVRAEWSNKAAPIAPALFEAERKASSRTAPFAGGVELKALTAKAG